MRAQNYLGIGLRALWLAVRFPSFTLLAILAPVVRILFGSLALLRVLMAFLWKLVGPPRVPVVAMLCASVVCGLLITGYEALLRRLSRWNSRPFAAVQAGE
jgi:hypothetical protein